MKKKWSRIALGSIIFLMVFALGVVLLWDSPGVAAEDISDPWLSSTDPPEGISIDALSPLDQPGVDLNRGDEQPESRAVIKSHRIAGSALRPRKAVVNFTINTSGGCIYAIDNAFDVFNTPLWLPQGATIDTVRMYYYDTSGSNSTAWLTVYDLYGVIVEEWSVSSSGNSGNGFNDTSLISHTVDYNLYSYLLNWRPVVAGSTMQLCGFRIFYEPPPFSVQFLPYIGN